MAIRSFELEPTRENLLNTLTRDLLERNKSVWQFARFCDAQEGKCSIAIDAKWGQGKTFLSGMFRCCWRHSMSFLILSLRKSEQR